MHINVCVFRDGSVYGWSPPPRQMVWWKWSIILITIFKSSVECAWVWGEHEHQLKSNGISLHGVCKFSGAALMEHAPDKQFYQLQSTIKENIEHSSYLRENECGPACACRGLVRWLHCDRRQLPSNNVLRRCKSEMDVAIFNIGIMTQFCGANNAETISRIADD